MLYGLVASCSCAMLGETLSLDCNAAEAERSSCSMTVATMPSLKQLTLLRQDGTVAFSRLTEAMQLGLTGCELMHEQMAAALRAKVEANPPCPTDTKAYSSSHEATIEGRAAKQPRLDRAAGPTEAPAS